MENQLCWTVEESARAVGISRSKLYAEIASGSMPVVRIGRSVRVRKSDLEAWIERHVSPPEPAPADLLR